MAKMIPKFGPAETRSKAEPTIYALLEQQLSDDFVVIHSLPWLSAAVSEVNGAFLAPTGEIDFIVLHEELGVLAVEIKGGHYRIDGAAFVPTAGGAPLFVSQQTRNNVHGVARWLGGKAAIRWRFGYAMCFPDSAFPEHVLAPNSYDPGKNQRITLDFTDLPVLGTRVKEVMEYWKEALKNPVLGASRMKQIVDELCPQYDGTPQWAQRIHYDNQLWLQLTPEQNSIADRILRSRRGLVTGWPGTGKTLIGVELARRLSAAGERVLFVTFNVLLCDHLREQLKHTTCRVYTWHKLCNHARDILGRPPAEGHWFEDECLRDLTDAVSLGMFDFDILMVDEGQALRPTWWEYLAEWFRSSPIFVLCDETQVFSFEKETTSLDQLQKIIGTDAVLHLTVVMRMPRAVTNRLIEVKGSSVQISSPRVIDPDAIQELVTDDWTVSLKDLHSSLISQGVAPSDIVVLSKTRSLRQEVQEFLMEEDSIRHVLVSQFRGMESPVVLVVEANSLTDSELFSAYSRATTVCIAMFDAGSIPEEPKSRFLQTVASRTENQELIEKVRYRNSIPYKLSKLGMTKVDAIHSADVTWSRVMNCWHVVVDRDSPVEMWVDFLRDQSPWQVLFNYQGEPRHLYIAGPAKSEDSACLVRICECDFCYTTTPHNSSDECLLCSGTLGQKSSVLLLKQAQFLENCDLMIRTATTANRADLLSYYHRLPFLLGAMAVGLAAKNLHLSGHTLKEMPNRSSAYRAAVLLAHAKTVLSPPGGQIRLHDLVTATMHRDFEKIGLDRDAWHKHLANALSRLYQQGMLTKLPNTKGVWTRCI